MGMSSPKTRPIDISETGTEREAERGSRIKNWKDSINKEKEQAFLGERLKCYYSIDFTPSRKGRGIKREGSGLSSLT